MYLWKEWAEFWAALFKKGNKHEWKKLEKLWLITSLNLKYTQGLCKTKELIPAITFYILTLLDTQKSTMVAMKLI